MTLPFATNRYHVTIWMVGGLFLLGVVATAIIHLVKVLS